MASYLSWLRIPFLASSGLAAAASGLLYWKQNELIYPRNLPLGARTDEGVPRPNQFGISDYEDLRITTPDGETLSAFFIRPSNKRQARKLTILMFHGNAGNIGHRVPIAKVLEEQVGCNVFMLEYRGYGLSTGTPDEDGINIDAQTAIDYIRNQEETKDNKIIVYGESIGGACAIRLVASNQDAGDIAGLILINTFTSIRKMIPSVIPPARFIAGLCHQHWNSEEVLPQITKVPIIFMSSLRDEIVPPTHMTQLFSVCRAPKKIWRAFPKAMHNEIIAEPYFFDFVAEFLQDVLGGPKMKPLRRQQFPVQKIQPQGTQTLVVQEGEHNLFKEELVQDVVDEPLQEEAIRTTTGTTRTQDMIRVAYLAKRDIQVEFILHQEDNLMAGLLLPRSQLIQLVQQHQRCWAMHRSFALGNSSTGLEQTQAEPEGKLRRSSTLPIIIPLATGEILA
ncbi:MAG: hypothetical protein Q9178_006781 [Gyalolechia marmorata]